MHAYNPIPIRCVADLPMLVKQPSGHLASAVITQQLVQKRPAAPAELMRLPLPPPRVWQAITDTSVAGEPWIRVSERLLGAFFSDPSIRNWPLTWSQPIDDALPAITRDEALAVLERFLQVSSGGINGGVKLYTLQWLALTTVYCPEREHFAVLCELLSAGFLEAAGDAVPYHNSGIRFPLIVTSSGAEAIRKLKSRGAAATNVVTRRWLGVEEWWATQTDVFPLAARILTFLAGSVTGALITLLLS